MRLFKPATNLQAFAKIGILGFQGAGKTYLATDIMLGLCRHLKLTKPIAFIDTETGSDWALPRFKAEGVELVVAKTRAFSDLVAAVGEADQECSGLIVDSVSHFWMELMDAYKRKNNVRRIEFQHWADIKGEWQKFSDAFVNSKLHIVVCGRAGWMYEQEEDDRGKKQIVKTGTKMKAEGEFGFEPNLLIELERVRDADVGARVVHRAYILKDRRMDKETLDGRVFDNPTFKDFLPHVEALNLGGKHMGVDLSRTSDDALADPDWSVADRKRETAIVLEELTETFTLLWPRATAEQKAIKIAAVEALFGTRSWTAVVRMDLLALRQALATLRQFEKTGHPDGEKDAITAELTAMLHGVRHPISDEELSAFGGAGAEDAPDTPVQGGTRTEASDGSPSDLAAPDAPPDAPGSPESDKAPEAYPCPHDAATDAPGDPAGAEDPTDYVASQAVDAEQVRQAFRPKLADDPVEADRQLRLGQLRGLKKSKPEAFKTALFDAEVKESALAKCDPALLGELVDTIQGGK